MRAVIVTLVITAAAAAAVALVLFINRNDITRASNSAMIRDLVEIRKVGNQIVSNRTQLDYWSKYKVFVVPPGITTDSEWFDRLDLRLNATHGSKLKKLSELDADLSDAFKKLNLATDEETRRICDQRCEEHFQESARMTLGPKFAALPYASRSDLKHDIDRQWVKKVYDECKAAIARLEKKHLPARAFK